MEFNLKKGLAISDGANYKNGRKKSLSNDDHWTCGSFNIHLAILLGMEHKISDLIKEKSTINLKNRWGSTPLKLAVLADSSNIESLLKAGALIDSLDRKGRSSLHYAAEKSTSSCLKLLLQYSNDIPKHILSKDVDSITPLHLAARSESSNCLLTLMKYRSVLDINCISNRKEIPLHWAAAYGREENVKLLLKAHADQYHADMDGRTALHLACLSKKGNKACVKALLSSDLSSINLQDNNGFTPLHFATILGHTQYVETLVSKKGCQIDLHDHLHRTVLHFAAFKGNENAVKIVLANGASVNVGDVNQLTPLHYAVKENHDKVVEMLVQHPNSRETASTIGHTPLHYAAKFGSIQCLTKLLNYGAQLERADIRGCTPLHVAAQSCQKAIVNILLKVEASVKAKTKEGFTPFLSAVTVGDMQLIKMLLKAGSDLRQKDNEGKNALHHSVLCGHLHLSQSLIKSGILVDEMDAWSRTPLHYAVLCGFTDILCLLLESGADVNARDGEGMCALHLAVEKEDINSLKILLAHGANPNYTSVNESRVTPWDLAKNNATLKLLEEAGGVSRAWILNAAALIIQRYWKSFKETSTRGNVNATVETSKTSLMDDEEWFFKNYKLVRFRDTWLQVPVGEERDRKAMEFKKMVAQLYAEFRAQKCN